jgi:LCP family protein required for cell wall assembly
MRSWLILWAALTLVYFFGPLRTNILLLGTDDSPLRGALGRTDTIILTTVVPLRPYVGMLSIPRDLWLPIPGVGEQRINTAYYFAEAQQTGSGPDAIMGTMYENFGVPVHYYMLIHMEGLIGVVDALGGVDITLERRMGGLKAGEYHLNGTEALAFARERYSGDDFSRMQQGQILIQAIGAKFMTPSAWPHLPGALVAWSQAVETNVPIWQWPRLAFSVLRAPVFGVDARTITPEMVFPFMTSGGAQVLGPNWDAIRPFMDEMFGT